MLKIRKILLSVIIFSIVLNCYCFSSSAERPVFNISEIAPNTDFTYLESAFDILNDTGRTVYLNSEDLFIYNISATSSGMPKGSEEIAPGGLKEGLVTSSVFLTNEFYSQRKDKDPDSPELIHNRHIYKAHLIPVKNEDASYKLNAYGVPVIACSECGQVHSDFAVAHEAWLDEVENAVKNHKNFGTDWKTKEEAAENPVTITTSTFISFDKDMLSYLNSQPDAVILKFKYQGKYYVTTIPSYFDCLSLADENGWAGFAYIMSICGGREITEEEFKM